VKSLPATIFTIQLIDFLLAHERDSAVLRDETLRYISCDRQILYF